MNNNPKVKKHKLKNAEQKTASEKNVATIPIHPIKYTDSE